RREPENHAREPEEGNAAEQHAARAQTIDHETGEHLADAGDGKEHRRHHTGLREAKIELAHQPRKERRNHEMEKMRDAVRKTDEGDRLDFAPADSDSGDVHESKTRSRRRFNYGTRICPLRA